MVAEYMYSNLTELQVEIDCDPKCKQEKTVLIGWQSVNMCKFIFHLASKNRGEYLWVFPCKILTKILARSHQDLSNLAAKNSPRFYLRSSSHEILPRFQNLVAGISKSWQPKHIF